VARLWPKRLVSRVLELRLSLFAEIPVLLIRLRLPRFPFGIGACLLKLPTRCGLEKRLEPFPVPASLEHVALVVVAPHLGDGDSHALELCSAPATSSPDLGPRSRHWKEL
jgi:hypothetical protein